MNVLFLTSWYPTRDMPVRGVFVREHAKAAGLYTDVRVLHLQGLDRDLAGLWTIEPERNQELTEGIPTWRVWHGRKGPKSGLPLYLASTLAAYRRATADGFRPDVLHAHIYSAGAMAVPLGRLLRLPVIITEQSSAFHRRLLDRRERRLARLAFEGADLVCPVSTILKCDIEEAVGVRTRFKVIPNVVNTALFHPPEIRHDDPATMRLLFVSLMADKRDDRKGLARLLRILNQLVDDHPHWTLDVVGDGPGRYGYEALTTSLGLSDQVKFHGIQSKADVAEHMRRSDVLVHPTSFETFSVVVAEALATGLPVVGSATGAIPELIERTDGGVLVTPGAEDELLRALRSLIARETSFDRDHIAKRAAQLLSPVVVGRQLAETYTEVTRARRALPGHKPLRTLVRRARRTRAVDAAYQRLRSRTVLWWRILRSLRGVTIRDAVVLYLSAVVDTTRTFAYMRSWAPRTLLGAQVVDRHDGTLLRVRGGTDDIYFALPGREGPVEDLILRTLRRGDTMVDGGAHIGYYTIRAAQIVGPQGRVIAIEANPDTAALLRSNIELNGLDHVEVFSVAIGSTEGSVALTSPAGILGTSSVHQPRQGPGYPPVRSIGMVRQRRLDDLCPNSVDIRLLKLDIEGNELAALQGGRQALKRADVVVAERDREPDQIEELLRDAGFEVWPLAYTTYLAAVRPASVSPQMRPARTE